MVVSVQKSKPGRIDDGVLGGSISRRRDRSSASVEFWGTFNPMTDLSGPRCSNRVNLEDAAQVRLVEHDEALQKFATYRSDESAQLGCSATVSVALSDDP